MSSQPFQSSPPVPQTPEDDTPTLSITLVRKEDLDEVRKTYESISAIHIYSLGPTRVKDMQVLSDANREVNEKYRNQEGAEAGIVYGIITNKNVRKRKVGGPRLPAASAPAAKAKTVPAKTVPFKGPGVTTAPSKSGAHAAPLSTSKSSGSLFSQKGTTATTAKKEKDKKASPEETPTSAPSGSEKPAAPLKRGKSNSIVSAFAKAKPKLYSEDRAASSAAASVAEESPMKDVSDDEEDTYVPPTPKAKEKVDEDCKSRKEREAALARMMDESDDEPPKPRRRSIPEPEEEPEDEDEVEEVALPKKETPEPKEYVEIKDGRRRGRRRVMKRKTMKDEEGYLVTKEEPAWESFSEAEPEPKAKPKPAASQASQKGKKAAPKGQGSIMSFFAKK